MSRIVRVKAAALLMAGALWSIAASGHAQQQPQVHIDVTPADSAVVPLLRAELSELGLALVDEPSPGRASIGVRVVLTRTALEVSVVDDATGRATAREVFSVTGGRAMDPRTAVLHAVELLRWQLRFTPQATPAAPPRTVTPEPSVSPPAASERSRALRFGLLPVALYSPGGTRLGLGGELDLLVRFRWLGVRLLGAGALVPNRLSVAEGTLEATPSWAALAAAVLIDLTPATSLELSLGAGLFSSKLRGISHAENLGADDHLLTFAAVADVRLRQRISDGFALNLATLCLVPVQASRLRVLEREVGRYGQALIAIGLGVELGVL